MPPSSDDGLSAVERAAYSKCQKLSCENAACARRFYNTLQKPNRQDEKCGHLFKAWETCFKAALVAEAAAQRYEK